MDQRTPWLPRHAHLHTALGATLKWEMPAAVAWCPPRLLPTAERSRLPRPDAVSALSFRWGNGAMRHVQALFYGVVCRTSV